MTQHLQTQPVQTPEQPGFLRRGADFLRSTPWVAGAEITAHSAVDKAPGREVVALGTAVLALGVLASEASAQGEAEISAAEGSREVVRTSLDNRPSVSNVKFVWKRNKNGKRVPTKKMRFTVSDSAGNPGDWDLSPGPFLDKPVEIKINQVNRPKGSKKRRKKSSSVATVTMPSDYTRHDIFAKRVTVILDRAPNIQKDDWALEAREAVDPIVGGPQSRKTNIPRPYVPKSLGPVT
jgi:hypothetical protein